jgi:Putative prokaryotic signal transducing protein
MPFAITYESMPEERQGLGGELVQVAYAQNRVEAEMIQGLLDNGSIPSALQALGVNGPQLGYGVLVTDPQRVMVRADQAEQARALLAETLVEDEQEAWPEIANARHLEEAGGRKPRGYGLVGAYARIYLWSFGIVATAFGIFLLLRAG